MKFFFPDSQDQIDPSFDFEREASSPDRVRQRDDRYAHEVISPPPYSGMLLSKALIDGPGRYTFAQRHRLFRLGVREFFRLDEVDGRSPRDDGRLWRLQLRPRGGTSVQRRRGLRLLRGVRVRLRDLGRPHHPRRTSTDSSVEPREEWRARQDLTLEYAAQFFRRHRREKPRFVPLGVAQGWDPASYAKAVRRLQRIGYRYIALGGMVPLKTPQILACLEAIARVRRPRRNFHLLGITRTERVNDFSRYGVASIDSTSPFQQSFKDDRDNYHTLERNYVAIRVMQIDGNQRLKRRILAGELDQNEGRRLERACLSSLTAYDRGKASLEASTRRSRCLPGLPGRVATTKRLRGDTRGAAMEVVRVRGVRRRRHPGSDLPRHGAQQASRLPQPPRLQSPTSGGTRDGRMSDVARPRTRDRPEPGRRVYSFGVDGKMLHRIRGDLTRRPKRRPVDQGLPAPRGPRAHPGDPLLPRVAVTDDPERDRRRLRRARAIRVARRREPRPREPGSS